MSRRNKIIILSIFGLFILIKSYNLKNYNFYQGRVIGFERIGAFYAAKHGKEYRERDIPIIKYYNKIDTLTYSDAHRVIFSLFLKNEKVTIMEDKRNYNKVTVFSFFYYWIKLYELILLCLVIFIFYGYRKFF